MDTFSCRSEFGGVFRIPIVVMISSIIICGLFLKDLFLVTFIVFGICILILIAAWAVISYHFDNDELVVKVPSQTVNITYASVTKITVPGMNDIIQGSSLRTIGIYYGKNSYVCISPVKRDEIIELLRRKCPNAGFEDRRPDTSQDDRKTV